MKKIQDTLREDRIVQLRALRAVIADQIDQRPGARDLASLAKQFREISREIQDLEDQIESADDIAGILKRRAAEDRPGYVRGRQKASSLLEKAYQEEQSAPDAEEVK